MLLTNDRLTPSRNAFQWAPTLGGECYDADWAVLVEMCDQFQWAPTLGGECYTKNSGKVSGWSAPVSMGTHPWG